MNKTVEKLREAYTIRFGLTAICVVASVGAARLIWLDKVGGNFLPALGIAIIGGWVGLKGTGNLIARWKQLKQLSVLQEHGPYDTREYVHPGDAARQVGNDERNMWG